MEFNIESYMAQFPKVAEPPHKKEWVEVYEEMTVHTRGDKPVKLLETRRPNEDDTIFKYRVSIYEPITKKGINKAVDNLIRIFSNAQFSIRAEKDIERYLWEPLFEGSHFLDFIQSHVTRRMIEDPNGYLVWMPEVGPDTVQNEQLRVLPVLVESEDVKSEGVDHMTFEAEDERSLVVVNGKLVEDGEVYYCLTVNEIWRIEQYGTKAKKQFRAVEYYRHELGYLPCVKLGGIPTGEGFLRSFFDAYNADANEAIRLYTDWQATMVTSAFPFKEELAEECTSCHGGVVYKDGTEHRCRSCGGTGLVKSVGPYGTYLRRKANAALEAQDSRPSIAFIAPPTDIIKLQSEEWRKQREAAEDALNLIFTSEAQSGTAKMIDRESQYASISKISNNLFDRIIYRSIKIIGGLMDIRLKDAEPQIIKPVSFVIRTEEDLVNEIAVMVEKGVPDVFIRSSMRDLADKRFGGDERARRLVLIAEALDGLYTVPVAQKVSLFASGIVDKGEILRSMLLTKAISQVEAEKEEGWIYGDFAAVKSAVEARLEELVKAQMAVQVALPTGGFGA